MCRRRDYHLPRRRLISLRFIPPPGRFPTFLPTSGAGKHRTTVDYGELISLSSRADALEAALEDSAPMTACDLHGIAA